MYRSRSIGYNTNVSFKILQAGMWIGQNRINS